MTEHLEFKIRQAEAMIAQNDLASIVAKRSPGPTDFESGAPMDVRFAVGAAGPDDKLTTLQQFYPDADVDPTDPDNFLYTDESGKLTRFNPTGGVFGFDTGDLAEGAPAIGEAFGGMLGAGAGAGVAGPPGAVVGAGLGAAAGRELVSEVGQRYFGAQDTRTGGERLLGAATTAALNAGGQAAGPLITKGAAAVSKRVLGGSGGTSMGRTVADFEHVGGATPTVGQASTTAFPDIMEGILANTPGGAGVIKRHARSVLEKAEKFIQTQGRVLGAKDVDVTGRMLQKGVENFVERFHQKAGKLFGKLNDFVHADEVVSLDNTMQTLKGLTDPVPGAVETSALLANPTLIKIRAALTQDMSQSGGITFGVLQDLRSSIGRKLGNTNLLTSDIPLGELKQIYGAISRDMEAIASKIGGDKGLKAFKRANKFYSVGQGRIEDFLQKVANKVDFDRLVRDLEVSGKEGAVRVRAVMRSLTVAERRTVTGTIINRMGRAAPGKQVGEELGESFSLQTFLTNWNKFSAPAKSALFEGPGFIGVRRNLDTIARVAGKLRENQRAFDNPSGTARAGIGNLLLLGGTAGAGVAAGSGNIGVAASTLGVVAMSIIIPNLAARLMVSPRFVRWLAQSTRVSVNGFGAHLGRLIAVHRNADPETQAAVLEYVRQFTKDPEPTEPSQEQNSQPIGNL